MFICKIIESDDKCWYKDHVGEFFIIEKYKNLIDKNNIHFDYIVEFGVYNKFSISEKHFKILNVDDDFLKIIIDVFKGIKDLSYKIKHLDVLNCDMNSIVDELNILKEQRNNILRKLNEI